MKTLAELSKHYRKEKASLKKLADKRSALSEQIQLLHEQERSLRRSINNMKTLIDFCIETGESPVEARLKNTPEQIAEHMNQNAMMDYNGDSIYLSQGLNITSSGLNSITSGLYTSPSSISTVTLNAGGGMNLTTSGLTKINTSNMNKP